MATRKQTEPNTGNQTRPVPIPQVRSASAAIMSDVREELRRMALDLDELQSHFKEESDGQLLDPFAEALEQIARKLELVKPA